MSEAALSPFNSSISSCSLPSDAASPRTILASEDLPLPTAPRPFPTKKSHARKQPLGHIPRPRNAFILFRCDYARQNRRTVEDHDQNDVSRMVGNLWRNMTEEQRAPWVVMAEDEKKKHAALYPGYKYTPRNRKSKPTEKAVTKQIEKEAEKVVEAEAAARNSKDMVTVYYPPWATRRTLTYFARRATSCPPPGSIGIEPYSDIVDRAMVTINAPPAPEAKPADETQSPSRPATEVFVPSAYSIPDGDSACPAEGAALGAIHADHMLSQRAYVIDPPGGTNSWGAVEDRPSPSLYPGSARKAEHAEHAEQPPRNPADVFDPSTYGIHEGNYTYSPEAAQLWATYADRPLSLNSYTMEAPDGMRSWDEGPPSSYLSPAASSQYGFDPALPLFYTRNGEFAMSGNTSGAGLPLGEHSQSEPHYGNWWTQEIPALEALSSPSDTLSPSPITPTEYSTFRHSSETESSSPSASFPSVQVKNCQDGFSSEFRTVFHSPSAGYESDSDRVYSPGVNIFVRESSVRTTYSPYDGLSIDDDD